jgi:transcription antitermination protein NusB
VAARSKARKRALDVLFEADLRGTDPAATLSAWTERADPPVQDYARVLVEGVVVNRERIDSLLTAYAEAWSLERMPLVDRTVLRLAAFEILFCPDIPDAVAIDEAVELAKSLSTNESPAFVNGVLAKLLSSEVQARALDG